MEQEKRPRGGQIGNHNALKHGYYSKIFTEEEKKDLCSAGEVRGLDQEIALLRHVIKEAVSIKDDKHQMLVVRAASALNKLMRTRQKIEPGQDALIRRMRYIYKQVAAPCGISPAEFLHLEEGDYVENENESVPETAPQETKNEYPEAVQL